EIHLTRGRANTLRLALSGQLGDDDAALAAMREALDLCVSCKGCRRECPTGVDMARMKIEFQYQWQRRHGVSFADRLLATLPRWAPYAARVAPLFNLRNRLPFLAALAERATGIAAARTLPSFRLHPFAGDAHAQSADADVVLLVDTF